MDGADGMFGQFVQPRAEVGQGQDPELVQTLDLPTTATTVQEHLMEVLFVTTSCVPVRH